MAQCDGTAPGLAVRGSGFFGGVADRISVSLCGFPCPQSFALAASAGPIAALPGINAHRALQSALPPLLLGEAGERELPLEAVLETLKEFQHMQGLRVLLSGGEPLLYSRWEELNERLPEFELRFVLLSNGLLLSDTVIKISRSMKSRSAWMVWRPATISCGDKAPGKKLWHDCRRSKPLDWRSRWLPWCIGAIATSWHECEGGCKPWAYESGILIFPVSAVGWRKIRTSGWTPGRGRST